MLILLIVSFPYRINTKVSTEKIFNENIEEVEFNSIDDYIGYSTDIIIGKFVSKEQFTEYTYKYKLLVSEVLKGDTKEKYIDVYESKEKYEIDGNYVLFLESWEGELYPEPVYTSFDKSLIINIDKKKVQSENDIFDKYTKINDIIKEIKKSDLDYDFKKLKKEKIIDEFDNLEELKNASDNIIRFSPVEISVKNPNVALVKVSILEQYKGDVGEQEMTLLLPSTVKIDGSSKE